MTLDVCIREVVDEFEWLPKGPQQQEVSEALVRAHRWAHQGDHLFDETLVTDTAFNWTAADGNSKDISSDLTQWRGEPLWITSDGQSQRWSRVPILSIREKRLGSASDTDERGGLAYAIKVDTIDIVAAFSSTEAVTVEHFKNPLDWGSTSGLDESPLLPSDYHDFLVYAAYVSLLRRFTKEEPRAWERKQLDGYYQEYKAIRDAKWKAMTDKHGRKRGWWMIAEPSVQASYLGELQDEIRKYR